MDDAFIVVLAIGGPHEHRIREQVVDIIRSHRAKISQIADLDRGGSQRQNSSPAIRREPAQVHGNVDLQFARKQGRVTIGHPAEIDEAIHRSCDVLSHVIFDSGPEGEPRDLEAPAIMALEHLGHQDRHRMQPEIRGKIPNPDSVVGTALRKHSKGVVPRIHFTDVNPRRFLLQACAIGQVQQAEGVHHSFVILDAARDPGHVRFEVLPIANLHFGGEYVSGQKRDIGLERCRRFKAGDGGFVAMHVAKQHSPAVVDTGIVGRNRDSDVEARQRRVKILQRMQGGRPVQVCVAMVRFERDRLVVTRQCRIEALELMERDTAVEPCAQQIRYEPQGRVETGQRCVESPDAEQNDAPIMVGGGEIAVKCDRPVVTRQGSVEPLHRLQKDSAVEPGQCKLGVVCDRPIEARQGIVGSANFPEQVAAVEMRHRIIALEQDGAIETGQRLVEATHLMKRQTPVAMDRSVIRRDVKCGVEVS